jgi:branched-chain amino acid transport system permease protein
MATLLGGGTVSFYGPILGSLIFVICKNLISSMWVHWAFLYGLSFVIILGFFPTGLMGIFKKKPSLAPQPKNNSPEQEKTRREEA